jgi:hypothetical protein
MKLDSGAWFSLRLCAFAGGVFHGLRSGPCRGKKQFPAEAQRRKGRPQRKTNNQARLNDLAERVSKQTQSAQRKAAKQRMQG